MKGPGTIFEQSVWTILEGDEFHRIPDCEACRGTEYGKLNACQVEGSESSKPKLFDRVFCTTSGIKFHSNESCCGLPTQECLVRH